MTEKNETKLIKDCVNDCRIAQKELYERYGGLFFTMCLRYSNNNSEAEQLLQDSFLKIFQNIKSYSFNGSFEGWMKKIVENTCLDFYKSKNFISDKKTDYIDTILEFDSYVSVNDALSNLTVIEILRHIQNLPEATRKVFNLFVFEGYNHKEIAESLSITVGTSQWHVNNARKILKSNFEILSLKEKKKKHETSKVG